jgi:hypothetical protein
MASKEAANVTQAKKRSAATGRSNACAHSCGVPGRVYDRTVEDAWTAEWPHPDQAYPSAQPGRVPRTFSALHLGCDEAERQAVSARFETNGPSGSHTRQDEGPTAVPSRNRSIASTSDHNSRPTPTDPGQLQSASNKKRTRPTNSSQPAADQKRRKPALQAVVNGQRPSSAVPDDPKQLRSTVKGVTWHGGVRLWLTQWLDVDTGKHSAQPRAATGMCIYRTQRVEGGRGHRRHVVIIGFPLALSRSPHCCSGLPTYREHHVVVTLATVSLDLLSAVKAGAPRRTFQLDVVPLMY